jgi:hypothetical protein
LTNSRTSTPQAGTSLFTGLVSNEELRQQYINSSWLVSIALSVIPAHWLCVGEQRLDAGFYAADVVAAERIIHASAFTIRNLQSLTPPISYPGRFKRVYAKTIKDDVPFLKASEMLHFRPNNNGSPEINSKDTI